MEKLSISYPENGGRLKTLLTLSKTGGRQHEVGTAFLPAGCSMPDEGESTHPRHEVSIILDGKIKTSSNGKTVTLGAGDIVSIPQGDSQSTQVIEDARLVYIFFDR